MRNILINTVVFAAGAAIGSVVTWQLLKTKYEQIAQEEIDSVKQAYANLEIGKAITAGITAGINIPTDNETVNDFKKEVQNIVKECNDIIEKSGYTNYSKNEEEGGSEQMAIDKPYVVSPEEYDEYDDYEKVSLTYYADHVLADDFDNIVGDVENTVGRASLNTFGQYEADTVYVRNDAKQTDYEITLDLRNYADVVEPYPGYEE